jgi:predicted 2-oxoglutarate/Fe(II)-dependent dioxygenase YbiX
MGMKTKVLYDKIVYFEDAIPNPEKWLKKVDEANDEIISKWLSWEANSEVTYVYGERKFLSIKDSLQEESESGKITMEIINAMQDCAEKYAKIYEIEDKPEIAKDFVLNKYAEGEDMGQHTDWNEDQKTLEYSFVIYLNDDYEGGELWFSKQDIKIKPKAGSIILFPSKEPYLHGSLRLTSGRKIFIPHFWKNGTIVH